MNYFGTDGIRLKDILKLKQIAKKLSYAFKKFEAKNIVIGKDTRKSGNEIEKVFLKNLVKYGINVFRLKIVPTACVAYYTTLLQADYGIVLTASHNPSDVNGIKIFNSKGEKLSTENEHKFEYYIDFVKDEIKDTVRKEIELDLTKTLKGKIKTIKPTKYITLLKNNAPNIKGKKIVIDCANGSSKYIAPKIFKSLGAVVTTIFNGKGSKINENCGAVHPEILSKVVIEKNADIGFAFDGDADRCVCVLSDGTILSGDNLLFALAKHLKVKDVVGTIYSNGALDSKLSDKGIKLHRSNVGDQEVKIKMNEIGTCFGGERSGHFIFSNILPTGDGILSSLKILEINNLKKESYFKKVPFIVINLKSDNKKFDIDKLNKLKCVLIPKLNNNGRIILRESGTEDIIRILVEHKSLTTAKKIAEILKNAHEKEWKICVELLP